MEQVKDKILLEEIKNALTRELNSVDIDINIENGKVTLSGFVDVLAEKSYAEKVVAKIPGVVTIDNSLTIAMDSSPTDKEIMEEVMSKFQAHPLEQVGRLGAHCKGGIVTIEGQINSAAEKMAALQAASRVVGVKEVVSHLTFNEKGGTDDASLCSEIERQFSLSTIVDADDINTSVVNGEVYLVGWLKTPREIDEAIHRASAVTGVKKIHSQLKHSQVQDSEDVRLTNELRQILIKNHLNQVKAFVVDEIVFLGGRVYAAEHKKEAEKLARTLKTIKGISNDITVVPH